MVDVAEAERPVAALAAAKVALVTGWTAGVAVSAEAARWVVSVEVVCLEEVVLEAEGTMEEWIAPVSSGAADSTVVADRVRVAVAMQGSEQAMARWEEPVVALWVAALEVVVMGRAEAATGLVVKGMEAGLAEKGSVAGVDSAAQEGARAASLVA